MDRRAGVPGSQRAAAIVWIVIADAGDVQRHASARRQQRAAGERKGGGDTETDHAALIRLAGASNLIQSVKTEVRGELRYVGAMSRRRLVEPVVRFCAVISSDRVVRDAAIEHLTRRWGATAEMSATAEFTAGGFYTPSMGEGLQKVLVAWADPIDPAGLADWKTQTNEWESMIAPGGNAGPERRLNLDPGYVSQAKLVLATVKDRDHRIYLRDGIFAEVTLNYVGRRWVHHRWSYPDYRTEEVAKFAGQVRGRLRRFLLDNGLIRTAEADPTL